MWVRFLPGGQIKRIESVDHGRILIHMNFYLNRRAGIISVLVIVIGFIVLYSQATTPEDTNLTPTPSVSVREANIVVTSPKSGDSVSNPITVTGKARVFENTFNYILRDSFGKKIYENFAMADAPDAGLFGDFTVKIPVPLTATDNLTVEVFEYSAKDGSVVNLVKVPVQIDSAKTSTVKAFFSSSKLDPQGLCTKVFPIERNILKTKETAFISLTELLKGVTTAEKSSGYSTGIPEKVRFNSVSIKGGTAYVDFDEALQYQIGGSCRVSAIRAQITETLKQFSSVKNVVISINGRTDDILQP